MAAKWAIVAVIVIALGVALWASDKITWEGERTIHTVRCEQGNWEGLACKGKMVAGRQVPLQGEHQQAGSAVLGRGLIATLRQVQPMPGEGSRQLGVRRWPRTSRLRSRARWSTAARNARRGPTAFRFTPFRNGCGGCSTRASTSTARRDTRLKRLHGPRLSCLAPSDSRLSGAGLASSGLAGLSGLVRARARSCAHSHTSGSPDRTKEVWLWACVSERRERQSEEAQRESPRSLRCRCGSRLRRASRAHRRGCESRPKP